MKPVLEKSPKDITWMYVVLLGVLVFCIPVVGYTKRFQPEFTTPDGYRGHIGEYILIFSNPYRIKSGEAGWIANAHLVKIDGIHIGEGIVFRLEPDVILLKSKPKGTPVPFTAKELRGWLSDGCLEFHFIAPGSRDFGAADKEFRERCGDNSGHSPAPPTPQETGAVPNTQSTLTGCFYYINFDLTFKCNRGNFCSRNVA